MVHRELDEVDWFHLPSTAEVVWSVFGSRCPQSSWLAELISGMEVGVRR